MEGCNGPSVNVETPKERRVGEAQCASFEFPDLAIPASRQGDKANSSILDEANDASLLRTPLTLLWRRLKWGFIVSLGKTNSSPSVERKDLKTAVATVLEVAIMGSALILTLSLQIQEVVGSRGGFSRGGGGEIAKFVFVSTSSLSFAFAFYSIVTSAVMLLSLSSFQSGYSDEVLQKLARWTYTPRICTLAGAFCLSVSALAGYFLGVERRIALVGSAVIGTGVVLTAVSTIAVLSAFRQFSQRRPVDHSVGGSNEQCRNDPSIDTEEAGVTMRKEEHGDGFVLEPARSHSCLTPLSSLSTSAGLSFRSPRLHS